MIKTDESVLESMLGEGTDPKKTLKIYRVSWSHTNHDEYPEREEFFLHENKAEEFLKRLEDKYGDILSYSAMDIDVDADML